MEKEKSKNCLLWSVVVIGALFVVFGVGFFIFRSIIGDENTSSSYDKKYGDALKIAMQFFEVQKSGKLEGDDKIPWRGDSGLDDGSEAKLDLSRGMYDAGNNMKFTFPMAFTATILEYGSHMENLNQLSLAQKSLKWITDFLMNAHPSPHVLCVQIGDPEEEEKCWAKPEKMSGSRPLSFINETYPGSEVAAEAAAAMAAASLVFLESDAKYSNNLLRNSVMLFKFAEKFRHIYSQNIPKVEKYYHSTDDTDEMLWAAAWLFHATRDPAYLNTLTKGTDFENFSKKEGLPWFNWSDKFAGTQVLLSRLTFIDDKEATENVDLGTYRKSAEELMCAILPNSPSATSSRTKGGLIWINEWDALQHPVGSAFLATLYSDYMTTARTKQIYCGDEMFEASNLRNFARSQADYVLGKKPQEISYLVGYGDKFPQFVHHRGASISS